MSVFDRTRPGDPPAWLSHILAQTAAQIRQRAQHTADIAIADALADIALGEMDSAAEALAGARALRAVP